MGEIRAMGATAIRVMMVEQLGFAIIPLWALASSPLISGTTRGTSGSIRKAEELSTNTAPAFTISEEKALAISFSAAPRTISIPSKAEGVASRTVTSSPQKGSFFPALLWEARGISSFTGNRYSSKTFIISLPTAPVAPNMPTLYPLIFSFSFSSGTSTVYVLLVFFDFLHHTIHRTFFQEQK